MCAWLRHTSLCLRQMSGDWAMLEKRQGLLVTIDCQPPSPQLEFSFLWLKYHSQLRKREKDFERGRGRQKWGEGGGKVENDQAVEERGKASGPLFLLLK